MNNDTGSDPSEIDDMECPDEMNYVPPNYYKPKKSPLKNDQKRMTANFANDQTEPDLPKPKMVKKKKKPAKSSKTSNVTKI